MTEATRDRVDVDELKEPPPPGMPLREQQVVALGTEYGECPIGIVEHVDDQFVTLTLHDWFIGAFRGETRAYRLSDVVQIRWADWHRTTPEMEGRDVLVGVKFAFDMKALAASQTRWKSEHAPAEAPSGL